jgi:hypothetical protein
MKSSLGKACRTCVYTVAYIVGLHSGNVPLDRWVKLPTGDITNVVNRGVAVSRWAQRAVEYRRSA